MAKVEAVVVVVVASSSCGTSISISGGGSNGTGVGVIGDKHTHSIPDFVRHVANESSLQRQQVHALSSLASNNAAEYTYIMKQE